MGPSAIAAFALPCRPTESPTGPGIVGARVVNVARAVFAPLLAAALLLQVLAPWAWDRDRMLAAAQAHNPQAVLGVQALHAVIGTAQGLPELAQLQAVNRFFNERIAFAEDIDTTGQIDDWASPVELLARGAGDCEDYSIAKYFSLISAGVPSAKLRLVYVRADQAGVVRAHMVLAYYAEAGAEPLVLDNLRADIQPASARRDLKAVFSFNAEGLWNGTGNSSAGDPLARLSRWREVLAKARAEGFV